MQYPAVFLMENSVQFEILKNMRMTMWNGLKLILHEIRKILVQIPTTNYYHYNLIHLQSRFSNANFCYYTTIIFE